MEANKEEALKAKDIAEKRFYERDYAGAKNYALKAKTLCPGLEGISQLVSTFEVYIASEAKFNGEVDYYSVLGLKPFSEKDVVKKQYKKMAVLLHPDKNKSVGADGAFKLLSEAWTVLSDNAKRKSYDHRNRQHSGTVVINQTSMSSVHGGVTGYSNCSNNSPASQGPRLDTFWTVCTSCKVQYEYLRKYVNKRLSCKNCRGVFIAVETGTAPINGSFPYAPWPYAPPSNGYGSHGYDTTYAPSNSTIFSGNGVSGFHSGHGYEYVSNVSFQWSSSYSGTNVVSPTGPSDAAGYHGHGSGANSAAGVTKVKPKANGKRAVKNSGDITNSNHHSELPGSKVVKPDKRRKVLAASEIRNGYGYAENEAKPTPETKLENGTHTSTCLEQKVPGEIPTKRFSVPLVFDARKLLIDKARTAILKKLSEIKLAPTTTTAAKKTIADPEVGPVAMKAKEPNKSVAPAEVPVRQLHINKTPLSITVPDPDFHDFDNDRSEECFKPKQIWALYDEEDGMPRLYCLIREVISVSPFKVLITYLNSKTDTEFGDVNWLYYGFTKSCGNFRAWTSDVVDQVNVFSHVLAREKAGRGGCVRLFPRSGDVWAVYRNWSTDWDRTTPDKVRHQYEMVEVLEDYSEELGVCVAPLVKVAGFKTVYGRACSGEEEGAAVRWWIPRREMVRFSHQVPSWLLRGEETGLLQKCWDLDPAATPDDLLHRAEDMLN